MLENIVLAIFVLAPLLLGVVFLVNPSFLFFSVMAGELLGRYFGEEAELAALTMTNNETLAHYAEVAVLCLPVLLTAMFLKKTMESSKIIFAWVPLLVTGAVLAAFALPILPQDVLAQVTSTELGANTYEAIDFIIGVVVVFQLLSLWIFNKAPGHSRRKKKSKH